MLFRSAEKLEVIGSIFEIEGMNKLLNKFKKDQSIVQFNAIVIQIESLLLKNNAELADRVVAMSLEKTAEEVEKLSDSEYAIALRNAITGDVMGFFASSGHTDGQK